MLSSNNLDQNIEHYWQANFPESPLQTLVEFPGGQSSNLCFLINSRYVLKIYFDTINFEKTLKSLILLEKTGFTPKILKASLKGDLKNPLRANCILMEYISGPNLAKNLAKSSDQQKYIVGQEIALVIYKIHNSKILRNQTFNTASLLDLAKKRFRAISDDNHLPSEIAKFASIFLSQYQVKDLVLDLVLVHGDIHLGNFIQHLNQIYAIDFDLSDFGPRFFEARILLHQVFMPANLVSQDLENSYPTGSMLPFLKGILSVYAEILPKEFLPEIKLITLTEILRCLDFSDQINDQETRVLRAQYMFDQIFVQNILEIILA